MTAPSITCMGCGTAASPENPRSNRCQQCPPEFCVDCGRTDHVDTPCRCWRSLGGMALPELKALFAINDLSITHRPEEN